MIGKLLVWLINRLFGFRYQYFELRKGKYLKVRRGAAEIVDLEDVPPKHRTDRGSIEYADFSLLENASQAKQLDSSSRLSVLKRLDPFVVLEKALTNSVIERDVLQSPELVNASSPVEAQLKLDLVDGKDIEKTLDGESEVSENDAKEMLDTEFLAKWGYNKYGDDFADKINDGPASDDSVADSVGSDARTASSDTSSFSNADTGSTADSGSGASGRGGGASSSTSERGSVQSDSSASAGNAASSGNSASGGSASEGNSV